MVVQSQSVCVKLGLIGTAKTMSISIQIPESLEAVLRSQIGDLDQVAKEALAIEAYRSEKLSIGQVAELLGLTVYEAEGFMKRRGVPAPFTLADFEHDRATLKQLLSP
jgi:predicted HTH domain antitoxin